jgi:hypothetical protein
VVAGFGPRIYEIQKSRGPGFGSLDYSSVYRLLGWLFGVSLQRAGAEGPAAAAVRVVLRK